MNEDRYAKYGAASGIAFVVLLVIGFLVVAPKPPHLDAPVGDWSKYYTDHKDAVRAAVVVLSVALFFFIWFLGTLSSALRAAIGSPRLPTIAFGGGILAAASLMITVGVIGVAGYRPEQLTPELTRALNDVGVLMAVPAAAGITAFYAAIAIVALRSDPLPDWLGWLSAVTAVLQPLAFGAPFTQSGAFAGDGVLGLFVPFILSMVTIVAIAIVLMQAKGGIGISDRVRGAVTGAAGGLQGKGPGS
jgi:hypothetical protein